MVVVVGVVAVLPLFGCCCCGRGHSCSKVGSMGGCDVHGEVAREIAGHMATQRMRRQGHSEVACAVAGCMVTQHIQ